MYIIYIYEYIHLSTYIIKWKSISNIVLYMEQIIFYRKIPIYTNYNSNLTEIKAGSTTDLHKFMFWDNQNKDIILL